MTITRIPLRWFLAFSLLLGGCGRSGLSVIHGLDGSIDGENSSSPVSSNPLPNGQCPSGLAQCGKDDAARCYDLARSREHCGACGHACALGIACHDGECQQYRCKGTLSFKALAATNTGDPYQPPSGDHFTLGDFDGDGVLDVIGLPEAGAPVSLLFGAGDGTFPARRTVDDSAFHHWGAWAADLDGDGKLDLASVRENQAAVTVRLGTGSRDDAFGAPTGYPTGESPYNLLLADFDGDGRLDLVAGEQSTLEYWHGESGGKFGHLAKFESRSAHGESPAPILQAADWNRDGVPDLVYGGPNLHLRYGLGDGSFGQGIACGLALDTPAIPPTKIAADLDHDGRIDLAVRGTGVLLGLDGCNPTRIVPVFNPFQFNLNSSVELADLDGDDNLDVVSALEQEGDANLGVYIGNGKGDFAKPLSFPSVETANGGAFLVGDLNRDGKLDVIVSGEGAWRVLLNTCQ